ncbi:MAG: hypothetical protein ACREJC_17920 [Tepidisphaeraceae bacterium]
MRVIKVCAAAILAGCRVSKQAAMGAETAPVREDHVMRTNFARAVVSAELILAGLLIGCHDNTPPPPRVPVPSQSGDENRGPTYERDAVKPLPPQPTQGRAPRAPFSDPPLVSQQTPEQPAFVSAYNRVGRPRIGVLVSSDGDSAIPQADCEAIQTLLADSFAASGQVTMISAAALQQPNGESAADVIVRVTAREVRKTEQGAAIRLIGDAVNCKGGESLGRSVVEIPPPADHKLVGQASRMLARKLMDDMTGAWSNPPTPQGNIPVPAAPANPPRTQ